MHHIVLSLLMSGCIESLLIELPQIKDTASEDPVTIDDSAAPIHTAEPTTCESFSGPQPYVASLDESCRTDPEPEVGLFEPVVEWKWSSNPILPGYHQVMSTPAVANLDDDNQDGVIDENDSPEIIFTAWKEWYNSESAVTVIRGDGSGTVWSIAEIGGELMFQGCGSVAVGDLEGDGSPDICTAGMYHSVVCLEADGRMKWAAGDVLGRYGGPSIADMDGDGHAEVVFGPMVFDFQGNLLGQAAGTTGDFSFFSFPADMDADGIMEVVNGTAVHEIAGTYSWNGGDSGTIPSIADMDGDGLPEIVSTGAGFVTVYRTDGTLVWQMEHPYGPGGAATIADLDGDGAPEIAVAGHGYMAAFDTDGRVMWTAPTQDVSTGITGASVFDFEGDGIYEVVHADENTLWVFSGPTGDVRMRYDEHSSGTIFEYPIIADADHDGTAELIVPSNDYYIQGSRGITVIGDRTGSWAPARPIWNQFAYHVTNVLDNASIPVTEEHGWLTGNTFRAAPATGALQGEGLTDLAPGQPSVCSLECDDDQVTVWIPVENRGMADAGPFNVMLVGRSADIRYTLYTQDLAGLAAQDAEILGPFVISREEWADSLEVDVDQGGASEECQEGNNTAFLGAWPCK